ncbi:TetR/AcrR family transcriptional regulator [Terriglobus saanensis]|uniref:Regulatory protein TetR n=1 Tax=Terriglobus saanensis (strain ATCC BAA-1853 / DSM 23119 / SP1PR4) TaxID=401053 RepID=E8V818_TERSS|nr:TetR/AcrR family transcriptional regulator [Terriglobus saanensis]ADV84000.1 regulatory protein TetR [Terriglobus saanensis SP1PR4]
MSDKAAELVDPRIRRTRLSLQQALGKLLDEREFEKISVQDIAEAAAVNRATFYDHYPDKFALLECMVGTQFQELLDQRGVVFDGTCASALRAIVLGVCDYVASRPTRCERQRQMEPHMEAAVIAVVRKMLLEGLQRHPPQGASPEMVATAVSWAIYGAAKEWLSTPARVASEEIVGTVMGLVVPMLAEPTPQVLHG